MRSKRDDLSNLKTEYTSIQNSIREFQGELNRNQRELKRKLQEIASLENMIAESKERNERDVETERQERLERISNFENELQKIRAQLQDSDKTESILCNEENDLERRVSVLRSEINESKYKISEAERQLQKIRAGMQQRINVYGPEMKQVLEDIETANRRGLFSKKPVGPIGLYVTVKDDRWSFAVETFLKSRLNGFCCDNSLDSKKLDEIFKKNYRGKRTPPINISKFQASHANEAIKVQSSFPTVLDVLEIKDPVIANFLIDQYNVETVLLIDDAEAARSLMMYNPPRGCTRAFTLNGDELRQDPFRHYSCYSTNILGILKSLSQAELKGREEHLKKEKSENLMKENMLRNVQRDLNEKKKEREEHNRQRMNLFAFKSNYERKLNDEKCYEEPKDISNLQGDLDQLIREKDMFEAEIERVTTAISKQNDQLSKVNAEFQSKKTSLKNDQDESCSASEKVVTFENAKERKRQAIQNLEINFKKSVEDEKDLSLDFKAICKAAEKAVSNAEKVCPRIKTNRSAEMLRTLLQETTKAFNLESKQDRESVQQVYLDKYEKLIKLKAEYSALEKKIQTMKSMCEIRLKKMRDICNYTKLNLTLSFVTMLKENKFIGNLVISFENKTLKIEAKPDKIGGKSANKQQTSNLSGGERSYVTIAFLLALWDRIEMPFRILDEYDVFMDSDNRQLSVNLLIKNAENKKNMQFIFLTPQELPLIRNCPDIKVHKMLAPKRNQN
ncbi:structural maintenance of chromosomes protein 6-like [Uloborus diversus]|uniref:structural maintenance of chromosomes protein 6-like n=1 Tax=Uloborus diversus TaxID=327109 RepID=UPI0024097FD6|nr:structural maintenance of chromosomes protein 6-like [Uloborus diversus]